MAGLLNLSMVLVVQLAREQGATGADMLQKAGEVLREWSPQLPE
jgi:hypothetical protein